MEQSMNDIQLNEKILLFNYHVSIRNIRGEKDDAIANCYGKECKNIDNAQKRIICKEACQQTMLNDAISKLSRLIGNCVQTRRKMACKWKITKMMKVYKDRIQTSKGRMKDAKVELLAANAIKRRK
jgi:hypothetical protein